MIQFELKDAYAVGVAAVGETTTKQSVNIRAGVVGLPDEDKYKLREHTVVYEFSNDLTLTQAKDGIPTFAQNWVEENYQTID
jgi:hypothetical protein